MNQTLGEVTWWAVGIAALAYFALGAAWFTPLFGAAWDRSIGLDRSASKGRFPTPYYILPMVGAVVTAVAIAVVIALIPATGPLIGTGIGAIVGLAIAAATLTNALTPHTPKPYLFATITGGYHLVGCTIAGLIIGALGT